MMMIWLNNLNLKRKETHFFEHICTFWLSLLLHVPESIGISSFIHHSNVLGEEDPGRINAPEWFIAIGSGALHQPDLTDIILMVSRHGEAVCAAAVSCTLHGKCLSAIVTVVTYQFHLSSCMDIYIKRRASDFESFQEYKSREYLYR